jgi:hypothetical protein
MHVRRACEPAKWRMYSWPHLLTSPGAPCSLYLSVSRLPSGLLVIASTDTWRSNGAVGGAQGGAGSPAEPLLLLSSALVVYINSATFHPSRRIGQAPPAFPPAHHIRQFLPVGGARRHALQPRLERVVVRSQKLQGFGNGGHAAGGGPAGSGAGDAEAVSRHPAAGGGLLPKRQERPHKLA